MKFKTISWDWKSSPTAEELEQVLSAFGLYVTYDPAFEGSDSYAYIISDKELSNEELKEIGDRFEEEYEDV